MAGRLRVYPEMEIQVIVKNRINGEKQRISGKPDWGLGYRDIENYVDGPVLLTVRANNRSSRPWGHAQAQIFRYTWRLFGS